MTRQRAAMVAALVITVLLLGNAARLGYRYYADDPGVSSAVASQAATTPAEPSTPAASTATTPPAEPELVLPDHPRVVVLGDGYAAGEGGEPQLGYITRTARALGWNASIVPDGAGSGFVAAGAGGTLGDRLGSARSRNDVDLVIVAGGTEDTTTRVTLADYRAAVSKVLDQVAAVFPGAQLLVVGPFLVKPPDQQTLLVDTTLTEESAAAGAAFLSPGALGWLGASALAYIGSDGNLTEDGQAQAAGQLQRSIAQLTAS